MSGTVSTRWFWGDWLSDPGLRACGYAARGLWQDMLCIAGQNKGRDYGFVVLNCKPLNAAGIAKQTGGSVQEVEALLAELEQNGVFSRDRRKAIYCRRMVRAEKYRGNGREGGSPKHRKSKRNKKAVAHRTPEPGPEPDSGKKDSSTSADLFSSDWPPDYRERFWTAYPRRVAKAAAMRALEKVRAGGAVSWPKLMAGVSRYGRWAAARGEPQYVKHPATWLNAGCWDDEELPLPAKAGSPSPARGNGFAEVHRMLRETDEPEEETDGATDIAHGGGTLPAKA